MAVVSCILINYNSSQYTLDAINSIIEKTNPNLNIEIIIVDNASHETELSLLQNGLKEKNLPNVKLIENAKNVGFGEGNNIGVAHSSESEFVAFLNNDILFQNDCLQGMYDFINQTQDCGICSPQSFDGDGNFIPTFDYWASPEREWLGRNTLQLFNPKKYKDRKKAYDKPLKVPFVSGSFMFMRKKDFIDVGQFDENIFLYYEETDLSIRFERMLHKYTYLVPKFRYTHFISKSTDKNMDIKIEQKLSLLYIIDKHYGKSAKDRLLKYYQWRYKIISKFKPKYKRLSGVLNSGANLKQNSLKYRLPNNDAVENSL